MNAKPKTVIKSVKLDIDTNDRVKKIAQASGFKSSDLMSRALKIGLPRVEETLRQLNVSAA